MGNERVCVYIPVEEYRELIRAQRDAEILKMLLADGPLSYTETATLCKVFDVEKETQEEE